MVVVEGPRFSTRAESLHYAAQGWSLVNMTGHPEAVLARELRQCYAAIALVTDMDAGVETGPGWAGGGVRVVRGQPRAARAACWPRSSPPLPDPAGCTCATWADGIDPHLRPALRSPAEPPRHAVGRCWDRTPVRPRLGPQAAPRPRLSTGRSSRDAGLSVAPSSVPHTDVDPPMRGSRDGRRRPRQGAGRRTRQHREAVRQGLGHAPRRRHPRPAGGDPDRLDRPRRRARPRRPAARPGRGDLRSGVLRQDDGRPARGGQRPARPAASWPSSTPSTRSTPTTPRRSASTPTRCWSPSPTPGSRRSRSPTC